MTAAVTNLSKTLRAAGIDPDTNAGMSQLNGLKSEYPGCVLLYLAKGKVFAFGAGGDAAIVRQAMGRPAVWETVETVDDADRERLVGLLVTAGHRVLVVEAKERS